MKTQTSETRYFIDLDLKSRKIVNWGFDDRSNLVQNLESPMHRIFITKGQYNKLVEKGSSL